MTLWTDGLDTIAREHHTVLNLVLILLYHLEERIDARTPFTTIRRQTVPKPVLMLLRQFKVRCENREVISLCMTDELRSPFAHLIAMPAFHATVIYAE